MLIKLINRGRVVLDAEYRIDWMVARRNLVDTQKRQQVGDSCFVDYYNQKGQKEIYHLRSSWWGLHGQDF